VLVNINPAYPARAEIRALPRGCKALIWANGTKSSDYLFFLGEVLPELSGARPEICVAGRCRGCAM